MKATELDVLEDFINHSRVFSDVIEFGLASEDDFVCSAGGYARIPVEGSQFSGYLAHGVSKVTLVVDQLDFVFKFPYVLSLDEISEPTVYQELVPAPLRKIFAKCSPMKSFEKRSYYTMEKAETNDEKLWTERHCSDFNWEEDYNGKAVNALGYYYNVEELEALKAFLDSSFMWDFHSQNLGYTAAGQLVIIDYSIMDSDSEYDEYGYSNSFYNYNEDEE